MKMLHQAMRRYTVPPLQLTWVVNEFLENHHCRNMLLDQAMQQAGSRTTALGQVARVKRS